jgi:NAD-dependent SIR2 family protein deacetylase
MPRGAHVFTSNVDGQFQRAGFAGEDVFEVHGSIHHLQCQQGCGAGIWAADAEEVTVDPETMRAAAPFPRCPGCGAVARPNILMFGDGGFDAGRYVQLEARYQAWLQARTGAKLAVIELGAGTAISTVRSLGEQLVRRHGATLLRFNPREPEVPPGQLGFPMGARAGLEGLQAALDAL